MGFLAVDDGIELFRVDRRSREGKRGCVLLKAAADCFGESYGGGAERR